MTIPEPVLADMRKQGQPIRWQGNLVDVSGPEPKYISGGTQSKKESKGPEFLTDEQLGWKAPTWSKKELATQTFKDVGDTVLGNTMAFGDMIAGLPGMALGFGTYVGARGESLASGMDNSVSAKYADALSEEGVPDFMQAPLRKLLQAAAGKEGEAAYDKSLVSKAMQLFSEGVEKGSGWLSKNTGGLIQPEDYKQLVNGVMVWAGGKGVDAARARGREGKPGASGEPIGPEGQIGSNVREGEFQPAGRAEPGMQPIRPGETFEGQVEQPPAQIGGPVPRLAPPERRPIASDVPALPAPKAPEPWLPPHEALAEWEAQAKANKPLEIEIIGGREGPLPPEAPVAEKPPMPKEAQTVLDSVDPQELSPAVRDIVERRKNPEAPIPTVDEVLKLAEEGNKGKTARQTHMEQLALGALAVGAGGWMYMNPEDADKLGVGGLMAAGAVKGKGGMWHPEAVTRLAAPLKDSLVREPGVYRPDMLEDPAIKAQYDKEKTQFDWSDRAIRNHLNKHMGTATDPLKDVRVPMMGDEVRWEDLSDGIIKSKQVEGPRGPETQWNVSDTSERFGHADYSPEWTAINSYLSHVGDYLREFVPADKLGQYDLVRAVKETAKQDEVQAAKMAKARVNQAGTVDYKVYPDGMKWVEVGVPAKEGPTPGIDIVPDRDGYRLLLPKDEYGNRTGEGHYKTKEEAQVAAHRAVADAALKNEGDVMGHCVGGYCEYVHSGESKIYSLRDEKGMSHVTVEVAPRLSGKILESDTVKIQEAEPGKYRLVQLTPDGKSVYQVSEVVARNLEDAHNKFVDMYPRLAKEKFFSGIEDIARIKGKQNRAPVDKYIPYVQDFVRSGKWGDVEDLQNAGLVNTKSIHTDDFALLYRDKTGVSLSLAERAAAKQAFERRIGEHNYVTRDELAGLMESAIEEGKKQTPSGQSGKVDPRLLAILGTAALGGVIAKDPLWGTVGGLFLGAALSMPGFRNRFADIKKGLEYAGGVWSTQVGNISPAIRLRARNTEMQMLVRSHELLERSLPFAELYNKLDKGAQQTLKIAVLQNDPVGIRQAIGGNVELLQAWRRAKQVVEQIGNELDQHGRVKLVSPDYFPRRVKDYEGLKNALGQQIRTRLETELAAEEKRVQNRYGRSMNSMERDGVINRELDRYYRAQGYQPGYSKNRTIQQITSAIEPFYHSPTESLFMYVREAVTDLETAKFFGRSLTTATKNGIRYTDLDASIGNLVGDLLQNHQVTPQQVPTLEKLLSQRFKQGERSPDKALQEYRALVNITTLGNFNAALTQAADLAMPVYGQGLKATAIASARTLTGGRQITIRDLGLTDHLAEEFLDGGRLGEASTKFFKWSGFTTLDHAGKNLMITAALERYRSLAQTPQGIQQIAQKYQQAYGNVFPQLVQDLRAGQITHPVKLLLFSELADHQPIVKTEYTPFYLENPNLRWTMSLKSFMVKMFDIARRDAFQEVKKGNVAKGIRSLVALGTVLGVSGAAVDVVKDFLLGRPIDLSFGSISENALRTFGFSEYTRDKMKTDPGKAIANVVIPPTAFFDRLLTGNPALVQSAPLIGPHLYNWFMGGAEKAEIRYQQKQHKLGNDVPLSPAAERFKEAQREAAKLRKEAKQ